MDNNAVQLVGGPCGQHGPYTFYKAFKYSKDGVKRIITLSEFFFVKLWMDSDLLCIGELQLLWIDKNSEQVLASLRLYFLPENTPEGRMDHGEDEVLAISEKVVLRVEDLITWITVDAEWSWGRLGKCVDSITDIKNENDCTILTTLCESSLDFADVERERKSLDFKNINKGPSVVILSYPRYCRYRSIIKRLEGVEDEYLRHRIAHALGGFSVSSSNTRILFCRDTFDYPELEGHELLCNHLAPKLKGRPRGKRKKRSLSPGSESNESECSITVVSSTSKNKILSEGAVNGLRNDVTSTPRRSTRTTENSEGKVFIRKLTIFMKSNQTPIGRIPSLGFKELDLSAFYTKVQKLGGYDAVTTNRLWKSIFDDLSGNHTSTSAATVIRRHYERFLLAYERHEKGEEYKPLPISERRRLKSKTNRNSASDAETSEGTSRSGNSTPVPQLVLCIPPQSAHSSDQPSCSTTPTDAKDITIEKTKTEVKTSSLRSVRVKPERLRDQAAKDEKQSTEKPTEDNSDNGTAVVSKVEALEIAEIEITEIKEEITPALTITEVKPGLAVEETELIVTIAEIIPIKTNEPITTAATPVQKASPEKAASPVEAKESMPIFDASDGKDNEHVRELIEIPMSPEIIELDSETYRNITSSSSTFNETILVEVKKQKLDILKQGGLEVTPVHSVLPPQQSKEARPSVIHQTVNTNRIEIIPSPNEKKQMLPPPTNHTHVKRTTHAPGADLCPSGKMHVSPKPESKNMFAYINGQSPPKVMQSKSIYSPSDKTIYGDPKEIFTPLPRIHAPKHMSRQTGGDILDLTVRSPQKPAVEIMHIPHASHVPYNTSKTTFKTPSLPLLDGRKVGSNLEITLVGPNNDNSSNYGSKTNHVTKSQTSRYNSLQPNKYSNNNKMPQKRSFNENYLTYKMPRVDEKTSSTYSTQIYPPRENRKSDFETSVSNSYLQKHRNFVSKSQPQLPSPNAKPYPNASAMVGLSNYLPQLAGGMKGMPQYMPTLEELYYSTLQRMYSPSLPSVPPLFPVPTPEQLQFYRDLMLHNSRIRLPFFAQDGSSSFASTDSNTKKQ